MLFLLCALGTPGAWTPAVHPEPLQASRLSLPVWEVNAAGGWQSHCSNPAFQRDFAPHWLLLQSSLLK